MACLAAQTAVPALAQEVSQTGALARLMAGPVEARLFTENFLAAVSVEEVEALLRDFAAATGPMTGLRADEAGNATILTESHRIDVTLSLDAQGRFAGLLFQNPAPRLNLAEALAALENLPGRRGLLIRREGAVLAQVEQARPLLIASAFKMAVLAELYAQIRAGQRDWVDVARIEPHHITHPSGLLQDFPSGSPVTLHTLAALMIAESDNTATNVLMDLLGREGIGLRLGAEAIPDVAEYFRLRADAGLAAAWAAAPPGERAALMAPLSGAPLPPLPDGPATLGWQASPERLCDLMEEVATLPVMQINPGLASPVDWPAIAYKGGSDTGVISLVSGVTDGLGRLACVALIVNDDAPVPEDTVFAAYRGLLSALADLP